MRAVYTGHETLTFTDYRDEETGRTLTAEPGGIYEVAPAGGRALPEIPVPWFIPLEGDVPQVVADVPAEEAEPEAEGPQPEGGEQQQPGEQPEEPQ